MESVNDIMKVVAWSFPEIFVNLHKTYEVKVKMYLVNVH